MKILITSLLSMAVFWVGAQQLPSGPQPTIGKPMPHFALDKITYFTSKTASLNDFKGKWLFLDFWFTGCVVCIYSFPKVNQFHKEFQGKINWIMVGLNGKKTNSGADIEKFYEKVRVKKGLEMPAAYDSVLALMWGINSMPHIIIVDPIGIVHSITSGIDMTAEKIRDLLDGKPVHFLPKERVSTNFDGSKY